MGIQQLIDPHEPNSLPNKFRAKRWDVFTEQFADLENMHVLDLGGAPSYWQHRTPRPKHVTVVNLDERLETADAGFTSYSGDATRPVPGNFDLVVSNSLIEHVGGHSARAQLAHTVLGYGLPYWVQTPYRYFPIEPHWLLPFYQFLPLAARVSISRHWRIRPFLGNPAEAVSRTLSVELISVTEMRHLFPEARIYRERFAGLTKSITAIGA